MTRIRATCPTCGEVELTPEQVHLTIVGPGLDDVGAGSEYRFACPGCTSTVVKPADRRVAWLLAEGGVPVSTVGPEHGMEAVERALAELRLLRRHPEQPPLMGPLTEDGVADFRALLDREDWYDRLLAAHGAGEGNGR